VMNFGFGDCVVENPGATSFVGIVASEGWNGVRLGRIVGRGCGVVMLIEHAPSKRVQKRSVFKRLFMPVSKYCILIIQFPLLAKELRTFDELSVKILPL